MQCNYRQERSFKTYSDLAASYARLCQSASRLERRLNLTGTSAPVASGSRTPGWVLPGSLSVLWGVGLFSVLEVDMLAAKLLLIAGIAAASIGLDIMFSHSSH